MIKHRILLLGLGFWGRNWLELIKNTERCELVGIAGAEAELVEMCDKYGIDNKICFIDYKEAKIGRAHA